jgi:hypothetical protein
MRMGKKVAFVLNQCPTTPKNSRALEAAAGLRLLGVLADPIISAATKESRAPAHPFGGRRQAVLPAEIFP